MIDLSLAEAKLFRLLASFFGKDQVLPHMSVMAVCGGSLPKEVVFDQIDLRAWAKKNTCLFTIVDSQDDPKLVIEFFSGFEEAIDVREAEHQRYLRPILQAAGIGYVTMSNAEFDDMLDPGSSLDLVSFLKAKTGDDSTDIS